MDLEECKNKVLNMDCLEFMKQVPDDYFDLILTDPPYGLGDKLSKGGNKKVKFHQDYNKSNWEDIKPSKEVFKEIFRISKNQIIWGGNYFIDCLYPTRGILSWDKNIGTPSNFSHFEMAWTSFDRPAFKHVRTNDLNKLHPTMKPLKLIEFCLEYAKVEKYYKIYDPFMGSGTTALACKSLGLDFWGTELQEDYCKVIDKRLQQVQHSLF